MCNVIVDWVVPAAAATLIFATACFFTILFFWVIRELFTP